MKTSEYIRFVDARRKAEWEGNALHPALRVVVLAAALWLYRRTRRAATLTHILRSREEQRLIYPNSPDARSVHEFGRGADLRTRDLPKGLAMEWDAWLNATFPYLGSAGIRTALVHAEGDLGEHLHIQIGPFEPIPGA